MLFGTSLHHGAATDLESKCRLLGASESNVRQGMFVMSCRQRTQEHRAYALHLLCGGYSGPVSVSAILKVSPSSFALAKLEAPSQLQHLEALRFENPCAALAWKMSDCFRD